MAVRRIDTGEQFDSEYPRVRHLLLDALKHSTNPSEDDLLRGLYERKYLLWTSPNAAAVTHITEYDNRLSCVIYLVAGNLNEILGEGREAVEAYANEKGCKGFTLFGRKGWQRVLETVGFKFQSIVMTKDF